MVTLPEPESGTKRPKLTTPKYGAFAMVLSAKQHKLWLLWKNNGAELSTTDIGLYNGAEFGQSSGFMLSMVKQLESPWNLARMYSKYFRYQYV